MLAPGERRTGSVDVDGHRVAVEVRGAEGAGERAGAPGGQPPLLLVNGVGGGRSLWEPLRAHLPPGTATIAYDAPGCGASEPARGLLSVRGHARVAAAALAWAGARRADVLGFSFGGMVAQQLALDAPGSVRRLVLVATGLGVGSVPGSPLAYALLAAPRMADPQWLRSAAPWVFGGRIARAGRDAARHAAHFAEPVHPPSYVGQLQAALGWSSLPWLGRLRQPTLVVAGDEDPLVPACNARLLAALIPSARAHVVRGGGHLALVDSPEEVAPVLTRFLTAAAPERVGAGRA
ncbi:alpha/beta fold hydrolase [Quadrisphaera sp. DSM 44207]|uniref:alpha/beta fold hydrolase n=1 Tax=Quadrisphaera sp. DSM 44207 TaxID=1881057 RepID=UPI000891B2A3|nr:alpha/beta hydrolase [Quadrisphaera sp. DSM 44207]SDQ18214.1 Pimeloyl-ACP methyl ester carboxylesterase [Quadrisphaera sp. DSM 44207]